LVVCRGAGKVLRRENVELGRMPAPGSDIAFASYAYIRQFGIPDMHPMHRVIVDLFSDTCQPKTSVS